MLKTIGLLIAIYCLAFLCSCQKEIEPYTDIPSDSTDTTSASGGYMPLTAGTYWVYRDSASGETDTATVLDEQWLNNDINYTKVHLSADDTYSYYGVKDHSYYLYGEQDGMTVTMQVLNDTASIGNSWVYDMGDINGVPAKGTGTVVEKLSTYTVQGETYTDVLHTQYVLTYTILGTDTDFATYNFYFAKGKGIIKVTSTVADITGTGNDMIDTQDLVDYQIK